MAKDISLLTLLSGEDSLYCWWQNELCYHSFIESGQPGEYCYIISQRNSKWPHEVDGEYEDLNFKPSSEYFLARNYKYITRHIEYAPYNKPGAIDDMIRANSITHENVLIVDPDCIFLKPFCYKPRRKNLIAQEYPYLELSEWDRIDEAVRRHCRKNKTLIDPVGIPIFIKTEDLAELAPLWLQRTKDVVEDPITCHRVAWIAEMVGYIIAAAELGIKHTIRPMMNHTWSNRIKYPLIHYCDAMVSMRKRWGFDKRTYKPWNDPYGASNIDDMPIVGRLVLKKLSEFAEKQGNELVDGDDKHY